ncbi:calcineurin B-like protein 6 [Trifolium pratense]|uniref:Calcineurin B-like protein 6 n=1 Tax=Trifolium pratense TaxID=57577 RepID=A0A2K3JRX3_TRIPR|nr:calcineurin B-like protein 6 [Trifolium pratense]
MPTDSSDDASRRGIGECIYEVLMPLISVVEVFVFAVTGCFNTYLSLPNNKSAYTAKDFTLLAQETRCNSFPFLSISISFHLG